MAISTASAAVSGPLTALLSVRPCTLSRRPSLCQQKICPFIQGSPLPLRADIPGSQRSLSGHATWQAKCSLANGSHDSKAGSTEGSSKQAGSHPPTAPAVSLEGRAATALAALALSLLQAFAPVPTGELPGAPAGGWGVGPRRAEAILYSPDTAKNLPRSGEVALRRSVPAVNPSMKTIQASLEEIFFLLRIPQRKPYGTMESNIKKSIQLATTDKAAILAAVPERDAARAAELYVQMLEGKGALEGLLAAVQLQDPDKVASRLVATLETVADLMVLQAPGLPYLVSNQFSELPRLTGRATVEFTVLRGDGSSFTVAGGGGPQETGVFEVVLDGYSAPLTAGNFATLLQKGVYDGIALKATPQAVLAEAATGSGIELPLEVMPAGDEAPIYRTPLDVQDGEVPVLPMSVFGAVCMAHSVGSETYSHPSQFFIYLYDRRNSGLGGLSFEEGQFSVFGYVTKGKDILSQLKTGDVIKSAKLVSGEDRIVVPTSS